jgi:hypothetical protein
MTTVLVFDPAMCCSTGVCGPSLDPQLARFAADLEWLSSQGVTVARFNLSQQPSVFAADTSVKQALEMLGESALPLVKVDGQVKSTGVYPTRETLASWAAVAQPKGACCGGGGCGEKASIEEPSAEGDSCAPGECDGSGKCC